MATRRFAFPPALRSPHQSEDASVSSIARAAIGLGQAMLYWSWDALAQATTISCAVK